jgi:hypothetical protein
MNTCFGICRVSIACRLGWVVSGEIKNMLLTGCGTSRHAAELGAKIMRDLDCFDTVSVMDAAEVRRIALLGQHYVQI